MNQDTLVFRNILESMSDGVMTINLDGRIVTFNTAAGDVLGYDPETVMNHPMAEVFFDDPGNDEFIQTILNAVYDASPISRTLVSFYRPDGRAIKLEMKASFLRTDQEGQSRKVAVVVVFADVTEIKRLAETEQRLTEELRSKHAVLQKAFLKVEESHDNLRTVLKKVQIVRIWATLFIILLFVALGVYVMREQFFPDVTPEEEVPIATGVDGQSLVVETTHLRETVSLTGYLRPLRQVNITAPFSGAVAEAFVSIGQAVDKGQLLLEMDNSELLVKQREADIAVTKAADQLRKLRSWNDGVEMSQARRSLSKAKMNLETQKQLMEELAVLFEKGIVTEMENENAVIQYQSALMDYEAAQEQLTTVMDTAGEEEKHIAGLELQNARRRLSEIEDQLSRVRVVSPVAGTVMKAAQSGERQENKQVGKGSSFNQAEVMLSVGDTTGFSVAVTVDEMEVLRVKPGQPATVTGEAFSGIELTGTVSSVSTQARTGQGNTRSPEYDLVVDIPDISHDARQRVRLGMSAFVEIVLFQKNDVILIPIEAVQQEGGEWFAWSLDLENGNRRRVKIVTGMTTLDAVEVVGGLSPGDQISWTP